MNKVFVSRGGIKLQGAIEKWKLDINNLLCLDIGSSTGGFVDCLIQYGASRVYAVDTSYGELSWKLRTNPKVTVLERTNILHLTTLPEKVDLVTIDAGWTRMEKVLPVIKNFVKSKAIIIALLKPQYEARVNLLKKGLLADDVAEEIKDESLRKIKELNFEVEKVMDSPIRGGSGNKEYLLKISISF